MGSPKLRDIPKNFLEKPLSKIKRSQEITVRKPSLPEILCGAFGILSLVIFIYIKMLQLEIQSQESLSQLDTYAALSLLVAITFLVTFASLTILRKALPAEI